MLSSCYGLNVFLPIPSQSYTHYGYIWRRGLSELIRFRQGQEVEASEDVIKRCALSCDVRIQGQGSCLQNSKRASPDSESASTLTMNSPDSRRWEITGCCLSHPGFGIFCLAAWTKAVVLFLHLTTYGTEEKEEFTKQKKEKTFTSCMLLKLA